MPRAFYVLHRGITAKREYHERIEERRKILKKIEKRVLTIEVMDGNLTKLSDRPADATEKNLEKR